MILNISNAINKITEYMNQPRKKYTSYFSLLSVAIFLIAMAYLLNQEHEFPPSYLATVHFTCFNYFP